MLLHFVVRGRSDKFRLSSDNVHKKPVIYVTFVLLSFDYFASFGDVCIRLHNDELSKLELVVNLF